MKQDLASIVGLLLKACPILRKSVPHEYWLEYLHTARFTVKKLNGKECDIAARAAGVFTIEEAIKIAETKL